VLEWLCYASAICLRLPPMASRHAVLLNHAESLCPARLPRLPAPTCPGPRASWGLCRGAFLDPARNVVLLTPSISLRPLQALSYTQVTHETPRIRSLFSRVCALFHFPYPVSPVFATLTRTAGVDTNNSQLGTNLSSLAIGFKFFIFIFFRILLHSRKDQFFSFHALPDSLHKTPGVGVGLQWHS